MNYCVDRLLIIILLLSQYRKLCPAVREVSREMTWNIYWARREREREGCFNWTVSRMILIRLRWLAAPGNWIRTSELASYWSDGRTLCSYWSDVRTLASHWLECFHYSSSAGEGGIWTNLLRWFLVSSLVALGRILSSHHEPLNSISILLLRSEIVFHVHQLQLQLR